jgi:WD40 repeat protein
VHGVAFSPEGDLLAGGTGEGTIHVWDVQQLRDVQVETECKLCTALTGGVRSVAFSPRGDLLAIATEDRMLALRDLETATAGRLMTGRSGWTSVAFSPDGSLLASGAEDGTVWLWLVSTGQRQAVLRGHADAVTGVAFTADGALLVSTSWDGTVRLWGVPP